MKLFVAIVICLSLFLLACGANVDEASRTIIPETPQKPHPKTTLHSPIVTCPPEPRCPITQSSLGGDSVWYGMCKEEFLEEFVTSTNALIQEFFSISRTAEEPAKLIFTENKLVVEKFDNNAALCSVKYKGGTLNLIAAGASDCDAFAEVFYAAVLYVDAWHRADVPICVVGKYDEAAIAELSSLGYKRRRWGKSLDYSNYR